MRSGYNVLILAGRRGQVDPVSSQAGVTHKAFIKIAGLPMIERLLQTFDSIPEVLSISVCTDDIEEFSQQACLKRMHSSGKLRFIVAADSPAASVVQAIDAIGLQAPLLITTADHPLLTAEMIGYFIDHAPETADFTIALARAETIATQYPGAVRTFYRFTSGRYSGCNLFLCRTASAAKIAEYWRRMERQRKKPWRIALNVGPLTILRFLLGWLSIEIAFAQMSQRIGAKIAWVTLPFAEAAIDVDKPSDLLLADAIIRRREVKRP